MSFDSYYNDRNKKNKTTSTYNGGSSFDNYYEEYKSSKSNTSIDTADNEKPKGFDNYYNRYTESKKAWAELEEVTAHQDIGAATDPRAQELIDFVRNGSNSTSNTKTSGKKSAHKVDKGTRTITEIKPTGGTTTENKQTRRSMFTEPTTEAEKKSFKESLSDVWENTKNNTVGAAKTAGNFLKGTAKGLGKGILSGAKFVYDGFSGNLEPSLKNDVYTESLKNIQDEKGNTLTGQALVDYLNNQGIKFKGKNDYFVLDKEGNPQLVKVDKVSDLMQSGIDKLTIDDTAKTSEKVGGTVGEIGSQILQMGNVGQATSKIQAVSNPIANRMIQSGALGAANSWLNSGIEGETDIAEAAKEAARSGLFFAAGAGASEATGGAIEKLLTYKGLQNNIPAYLAEQAAKGAAFSAAGEAVTLPTYLLLGDEAPTKEDIAMDVVTGAAFEIIGGLTRMPGMTKQSQQIMQQAQERLNKSGELVNQLERMGRGDVKTMNTLYDSMQNEIKLTRNEVLNTRLLGQEAEVNAYLQQLDDISADLWRRQQPYKAMAEAQAAEATTKLGTNATTNTTKNTSKATTPNTYEPNKVNAIENKLLENTPVKARTQTQPSAETQKSINLSGKQTELLNDSNRGVTVGKPYTNIDNGVINQSGNRSQVIPQSTELSHIERNNVEPNKSTPKTENATESVLTQNKGISQNDTKTEIDQKNQFAVNRLNRDTNKFEDVVFSRGEKVKFFLGNYNGEKNYKYGEIKGIRHEGNDTYAIDDTGIKHNISSVYKVEPQEAIPQRTESPTSTLTNVVDKINAKNETTFTETDRVQETKQYDSESTQEVLRKIARGEATLEEVRGAYEYYSTDEAGIKSQIKKMTVAELRKRVDSYHANGMKKDELVDAYYQDKLSSFVFALNGGQPISTVYNGPNGLSTKDQYKQKARELLDTIDEETFNQYMSTRKEKVNAYIEKRAAYNNSIKNPETLEDFVKAKKHRELTKEEQRKYEELKAKSEKKTFKKEKEEKAKAREEREKAFQERKTNSVSKSNSGLPSFNISEDVHSKTNEKLYVLKFDERLTNEEFKAASEIVKANGGYYSRYKKGYIFKVYPTKLTGEATVEPTETTTDTPVEQTTETTDTNKVKQTQADKLYSMADKLQEEIDYGRRDRLENTAKRQREADSAREAADRAEEKQAFIRALAAKAEKGELVYLDELNAMTQLDTLDRVTSTAVHAEMRISGKARKDIDVMEAIDHATMPLEEVYKHHISDFANDVKDIKGCKQAAQQLLKLVDNAKDEHMNLTGKGEELLGKLLSNTEAKEKAKYNYAIDQYHDQKRLYKMEITSNEALREALREYHTIKAENKIEKSPEQIKAEKIKKLENEAINRGIAGYFPTPKNIVNDMIALAEIQEGDKVLEPSAGSGDIADEIGVGKVDVVEYNGLLRQILEEKGHNVVGMDALEVERKYDKIIMNPPFEKNQDIAHVTKMYNENLNEGGRIVAITSAHFTFANDTASKEFRKLINESGGYYYMLPEGSFKQSKRSTGVNTCMVVLFKDTPTSTGGTKSEVEQPQTNEQKQAAELEERASDILTAEAQAIEDKKIMAQSAQDVVEFLKAQKDGKKPMKIYFSPELSGVDNIRSIGQYLKFTDDPRDYKLDTFQRDLADTHPECADLGLEEFGTWLVDQVTQFRENKSLLEKAELSYKETFQKLNISPKDMQSVKKLKAAIEEVESSIKQFPLNLQFFAEQQVKQYKSLLRQLESEGVNSKTIERVAQMQREFKAAQKALEREKAKSEEKIDKLIEKQKNKLAEVRAVEKEKATTRVEKAKEKAAEKLAETKEKDKAKIETVKEKAATKLNDEKAKRIVDRFKNISSKNKVSVENKIKELKNIAKERTFKMEPETKETVLNIISSLEGQTISTKSQKALESLDRALTKMKAYEDTPGVSDAMKERISEIKEINSDLTYEEFMDVYNSVKVLVHQNKVQNKLLVSKRYKDIYKAADIEKGLMKQKIKKDGRGIKVESNGTVTKRKHIEDKIFLSQLDIKNLCAKLEGTQGGPLKDVLYNNIVKGHTTKYRYIKKSMDYFAKELKDVDMKAIDEGSYTLTVNENDGESEELTISSLEKIAIALNSYNEKNRYSLVEGGFARNNTNTIYKITDYELDTLVNNLTINEKKIVDTILNYFDTLNQDEINKTTMTMFNYEGAKEKFYYPKKVVKSRTRINESNTLEDEVGVGHVNTSNLENAGFLKPKTMTKTPINLINPFEVVIQMMNDTANLSAYAPALRDARVLLKALEPHIKTNYSDSMYKQLADYVTAMTKPSNLQTESDSILNTLYNNTVTAIFGLNISTSAKQPLGIINAATEIEGKYLLKSMFKLPNQSKEKTALIEKYAPYLWYRGQGHINRDLSETNMKQSINKTFYNKKSLRDYATMHITKTDMYVAHRIWDACEMKVRATTNLAPGSEEFYTKVGEMATEITLTTQSNGEITHRSQLMRGDNIWKKSLTAFQGQAQTCYNQLVYAKEEFKETKNAARFTRKALLIALIPTIGSIAVGELVKMLVGKDNSLIVKYNQAKETGVGMEEVQEEALERLVSEVLAMNVYSGIAYDAISSANNFYGASSNNPLYRELQNLAKGVGYLKNQKHDKAFEAISESLMKLTGIPVDNIQNIVGAGEALLSGYDYSMTDDDLFSKYNSEINRIDKENKNGDIELNKEQVKIVATMKKYKSNIKALEKAIETLQDTGDSKRAEELEEKRQELLQEANEYFIEHQNEL